MNSGLKVEQYGKGNGLGKDFKSNSDTISKFGKQLKHFGSVRHTPLLAPTLFRAYELPLRQNLARPQKFCIVLYCKTLTVIRPVFPYWNNFSKISRGVVWNRKKRRRNGKHGCIRVRWRYKKIKHFYPYMGKTIPYQSILIKQKMLCYHEIMLVLAQSGICNRKIYKERDIMELGLKPAGWKRSRFEFRQLDI